MSDVKVTQNADGDYYAGFEVDGTFIPFASVTGNRVKQLQDRAAELKALSEEEGEAAANRHAEAANALPYSAGKASTSKAGAGAKGSES